MDTADLDARVIIAVAFGLAPSHVVLHPDEPVDAGMLARLTPLLERRLSGTPVGRIVGEREFWGLAFTLSPETLEPRPDTETLVEQVLARLPDRNRPWRFADIGTGTGAIAVSLLHELPNAVAIATDLSEEALRTARGNARRHGVAERFFPIRCDFTAALGPEFDFLVSNPPYIPSGDVGRLAPEVRLHDPRLALDGGRDGMEAYRVIVSESVRILRPGGGVFFEIGYEQAAALKALLTSRGFADIAVYRDLGGRDRVVCATLAN
ncbi:peptide chain release factor N(5)-glutamine methyltransferase [Stappia sp. F7233]|uniref:Release factor glutamine methyltransferase n=2 Tax=Stappia albiluteola TaxID=2758565 RepID=A0A839AG64_9HYPH|nr:peptide chain release factor N(5)-glutamine methyltransferase [Stappia albiluteola]